jgi:CheY-like chemotaxis protein/signal transduction histidine kinase/HAMP domain-containing protein
MVITLAIFADQVSTVASEVGIEGKLGGQALVPGASGTWRDLTDNVNQLAASLTTQLRAIGEVATAVTKGDLSRSIQVDAQGEVELLKDNINEMIGNLRDTTLKNTEQDWLKTNLARFTGMLQGQTDLKTVGRMVLSELAPLVGVQHGAFYLNEPTTDRQPVLNLLATYAYRPRGNRGTQFKLGDGLVGQAAYERGRILITSVPADYVAISSGLGEAPPLSIVVLPVLFEGDVKAVIELASFDRFSAIHLSFLDQLTESIGVVLNTIAANTRTENLLKQSQALTSELQERQEELQQTNEALEEKARLLSEQNQEVERRRREIDEARGALEQKAEQLALTSKYKSQFLANMSHELRTPLNSLLILSQQLAANADENLTVQQVEFAQTIRASGNDLLVLINDILDLSKIESGTTALELSPALLVDQVDDVERTFRQLAQQKALAFTIELDPKLPRTIRTDHTRLQQILKNLLSNAFKFTESGSVEMQITCAAQGWSEQNQSLSRAKQVIAFAVTDTGVGIPEDKHALIFEAFQQADMDTSRRFGGTGLGLSISREIAGLLGGEITLASAPGQGSTFTLFLPLALEPASAAERIEPRPQDTRIAVTQTASVLTAEREIDDPVLLAPHEVPDDRGEIEPGDRVMLIVEDDVRFARTLLRVAHERGFKAIVALQGEAGLALARKFLPQAITLDLHLPGLDGWRVLDSLKHDPVTRHIPVHVITGVDQRRRALALGAVAHVLKPLTTETLAEAFDTLVGFVDRKMKNLLVVEDNDAQRSAIIELIGNGDVHTTAVRTGAEALVVLHAEQLDCVVVDLDLPDMNGFDLIERIKAESGLREIPSVVYTGKDLTRRESSRLSKLAETLTVKGAKSPGRLLDETALFLHRVEATLPESKRKMIRDVHRIDPMLEGKRVLIVDDDRRNIFALASALERYRMVTSHAISGQGGIDALENDHAVDIVLMDIMMPEMDGFETIRTLRTNPRLAALPIVALTAKAMKGDREKCIAAGASDYITKPVDVEQLVSLLRVWLYR